MSLKADTHRHDAPMQHADPLGVSQPRRVSMILECNTAWAAFMHHGDQGYDALIN